MVVISSPRYVKELLDKRSAKYSNRPSSWIADQIFSGSHAMFLNPSDKWRRARKLYTQLMSAARCETSHIKLIEAEGVQMLRDFCLEPAQAMDHPRRMSNSIIMSMGEIPVFGFRTTTRKSKHMVKLYEVMDGISKIFETGALPPEDILPLFRLLPQRLWGNWKDKMDHVRELIDSLYHPCVSHVIKRREAYGSKGCFLDDLLNQQDKLQMTRHEVDIMCGNLVEGGSDTTATMMQVFLQAMAIHREALLEAQREMDAVVGPERSPVCADYDRLPHVAMLVKEIMRWRPVAPTAFPHATAADDEIDGMRIPKGATVIMNTWAIHNNATLYDRPELFEPPRFAAWPLPASHYSSKGEGERDHYGYGAGRRICPGIHLGDRSLWLGLAKMVWAFDIAPARDLASGDPVPIDTDPGTGYHEGFLSAPKDFQVNVTVRSEAHRETIFREFEAAQKEVFSMYEDGVECL
ncbi:O-methylsterigmatocystin oxidoreductase [Cytospora mali]|uniref:O-methylsterigmatocystin oxidoreductase n=1 Tax=Cytospora mali TaxID=578113 RepID=A0A194VDG3_CYTMA|nr:O-methylsterigmatocystin oxidoreductase [Valsa mali var. pyri (nom. inval.)]